MRRKNRREDADPYMDGCSEAVKVMMLCHLSGERRAAGKREKSATGIAAAIRKHMDMAMRDTSWMSAGAITVARRACKRTPAENREYM